MKQNSGSITLRFDGAADAETYVYWDNLTMDGQEKKEATVRVSGNSVTKKGVVYQEDSLYHFRRDGMTYNLGYSETGVRSCKITFTEAGTLSL